MKPLSSIKRAFRAFNLPTISLLALLQRTPVVQAVVTAEDFVMSSPVGTVLKSFAAVAASLGAMNSLAGATPLVPSSGSATGVTVTAGSNVSIAYTVNGTQTPPASWTVSGSIAPGLNFSGLTSSGTVNVQNLQLTGTPTTAGSYMVSITTYQFTNAGGIESPTYNYTVTVTGSSNTAPTITTQPQSQTVNAGSNVTFNVAVSGTPTPTLQWQKGGTNISGQTGTSLTLNNVQSSDAGTYNVVATNSAGTVTSNNATLTVNSVVTAPNSPAGAGAYASGATEVTLTWRPPGSGATVTGYKIERAIDTAFGTGLTTFTVATASTSYVDTTAAAGTTYYYRISATNTGGASSPTSTLTVQTPGSVGTGASEFINISSRAYCSTGNSVTIGGFVVSGSSPKRVLVRAVGPTLTTQGLGSSEVLADPVIELHSGASILATNDNWTDNASAITTLSAQVGAAPLSSTDTTSAAMIVTLNPGVYSFIASGKNNTSGIVLIEVYDADSPPSGSLFVNIATRAYASTGNNVTIGGFVVNGGKAKQVLVRAVGPTLTTQGIGQTEVLTDPTLSLYSAGSVIATNDNWGDNANASEIVSTGARIGATPFAAGDTASSALLIKLLPGIYSFIASGQNNTSGIVLVEVYDAD